MLVMMSMFFHLFEQFVTGKRVNRGAGFGLEIPVNYIFYGNSRVIFWLEKTLNKLEKALSAKIEKCVKYITCMRRHRGQKVII